MKKNRIVSGLLVAFFAIMQLWTLYLLVFVPFVGISVEENDRHQWVVSDFDFASVGDELNAKVGDIVEKIDGVAPESYKSVQHWRTIAKAHDIVLSRGGRETVIHIAHRGSPIDYLCLIGEGVCMAIAVFVFLTMKKFAPARYLSLVFLNIGLVFISLIGSIRGDELGKLLICATLILLPVVFLHFLAVFFQDKCDFRLSRGVLPVMYGVDLLAGLTGLGYFVPGGVVYRIYQFSTPVTGLLFLVGLLADFWLLAYLFFKHSKQQTYASTLIKNVWLSFFVSFFPFTFLSFIPLLLFGRAWIDSLTTAMFILFFPLSFTYLIATKQLYDIHIVFRRMISTTVISAFPGAAIVGLVSIFFPGRNDYRSVLTVFVFTTVIISFVLYSLEYWVTKLEAIIFPRKYYLQAALKKIAKNLRSISSFRELKEIILVDIVGTLQVYGGAIVFMYKDSFETISEGDIDPEEVERLLSEGVLEHDDYSFFEIHGHEEYTSYLVMTKKKTNTLLGLEESQWLSLIITYLAVSLENIYLIRKLTIRLESLASQMPNDQEAGDFAWFRKLLFELQEKERGRIAMDLHDTTMQDLFFLKRKLSALIAKYPLTRELNEDVVGLVDYVEIINRNLRQSCFELNPYLLQEVGLIQTVQKLIEQEAPICPFDIRLKTERAEAVEEWDLDMKRHIFRVVQELLNNAKKHSQASRVLISLSVGEEIFQLIYEDDGVGFDEKKLPIQEIGARSGIGMEQMRSRVLHLNGRLEIETSRGNGVKYRVALPLGAGRLPA